MTIIAPEKPLTKGVDYEVNIKDDGSVIDALSEIDRELYNNPQKSIFPLYHGKIQSLLQLIWNPETNKIYDDNAANAYGPNREYMAIMDNPEINLIPNSNIILSVHAD